MSLEALMGSGAECSGPNAVRSFTKHLTQDRSLQNDMLHQGPSASAGVMGGLRPNMHRPMEMSGQDRQLMDEFFRMHGHHERPPNATTRSDPFSFGGMREELPMMNPMMNDWRNEFEKFKQSRHGHHPQAANASFEDAFQRAQRPITNGWSEEFSSTDAQIITPGASALQHHQQLAKHDEVLEQAFHREFAAVQERLEGKGKERATDWDSEFAAGMNGPVSEERKQWNDIWNSEAQALEPKTKEQLEELEKRFESIWNSSGEHEQQFGEDGLPIPFEKQFEEIWNKASSLAADGDASQFESVWEDYQNESGVPRNMDPDPVTTTNVAPYEFEKENPFMASSDPFADGLRLMKEKDSLSRAALAFEAAVQRFQSQGNMEQETEAWTWLGVVQAENEKELPAIAALQRAVRLDPTNLRALMSLAVSYTNEGQDLQAYSTLERWIREQYPTLQPTTNDIATKQAIVTSLFLQAARTGPSIASRPSPDAMSISIDPDVQVGLGVLFYNVGEYDKAVDCFEAALRARPDDYLLWNRLGATLANNGRSEEAISAYHRALEIKPTFVRGIYNLGVSCMNIGCYREAAEHLLSALGMHTESKVHPTQQQIHVSNNLWDTLRRAFILMERRDLAEMAIPGQDVGVFKKEFEF